MKKIFALLILIIIAAAGSPYAVSYLLGYYYYKWIVAVNTYTSQIKVAGEFHPGYLTSTATTTITLLNNHRQITKIATVVTGNTENIPNITNQQIILQHHYENGPIQFDFSTFKPKAYKLAIIHTTVTAAMLEQLKQFYPDQPPLRLTTNIFYLGNGNTEIINPPFTANIDNMELQWGGFTAELTHNAKFDSFTGKYNLPNFNTKGENFNLQIMNTSLELQQRSAFAGLWGGTMDFKIGRISLKQNDVAAISANDFDYHTELIPNEPTFNMKFTIQLAAVTIENNATPVLGPLTANIEFTNIDARVISLLDDVLATTIDSDDDGNSNGDVNRAADVNSSNRAATSSDGSYASSGNSINLSYDINVAAKANIDLATFSANNNQQLQAITKLLLARKPGIAITDTKLQFPQGLVTMQGELSIGGAQVTDLSDLESILKSITGVAELQVPQALIYESLLTSVTDEVIKDATRSAETDLDEAADEAAAADEANEIAGSARTLKLTQAEIDTEVAQRIEQIMNSLVEQNIFVAQDKMFYMKFQFADGIVILNGKPSDIFSLTFAR